MRPALNLGSIVRALSLVVALCALPSAAIAADAPAAAAAKPTDDGWQAVNTQMVQPGESFEAKNLVGVAYGFIWVMVAGFVVSVWRRAGRIDREIESLRAQIKQKSGAR